MFILGVLLIGSSAVIASIEIRAKNKRKSIRTAKEIVHTNFKDLQSNEFLEENAVLSKLSLLEIYSLTLKHEETLKKIEFQCPYEIRNGSAISWFKRVEELSKKKSEIQCLDDILNYIPFAALIIFGAESIKNIVNDIKNSREEIESEKNTREELIRAAPKEGFSISGAKIGMGIGTLLAPGIGTIIGAGIGGFASSIIGKGIFHHAKERIKWDKIIDSIEYYGNKYEKNFTPCMKYLLATKYFNIKEIEFNILEEEKLAQKYKEHLNPYTREVVTLPAILSKEYLEKIYSIRDRIQNTFSGFEKELYSICNNAAKNMYPNDIENQNKARKRFLGEIIISNQWLLDNESLDQAEINLINNYNQQINKTSNHPYKLNIDSNELLKTLIYKSFNETYYLNKSKEENFKILIYIISTTLLMLGLKCIF